MNNSSRVHVALQRAFREFKRPLRILLRYINPFTADPIKPLQSARMLKIKNGGLDQYGAEPFEQQQLGTSGVEGVKVVHSIETILVGISVLPPSE